MDCPPPSGPDVAVGVRLLLVGVGLAEGVGDEGGVVVGVGVGVTGGGVGVGVAVQLQETWTEFRGPLKVIVSVAGQVMLAGSVMVTETCPLGCSIPPTGFMVTPAMPWLLADQVRLLVWLLLLRVTRHCLHGVRFVGEAASPGPASTKRAGAAVADLALETSGEHMARELKVMSDKSAKRLGRCVRILGGPMVVSSLLLRTIVPVVIRPVFLLGRSG